MMGQERPPVVADFSLDVSGSGFASQEDCGITCRPFIQTAHELPTSLGQLRFALVQLPLHRGMGLLSSPALLGPRQEVEVLHPEGRHEQQAFENAERPAANAW